MTSKIRCNDDDGDADDDIVKDQNSNLIIHGHLLIAL